MRIHNIILVVVLGFACAVYGQMAETDFDVNNPSFPYIAEITGDNVYVRSGPGTEHYDCLKLMKGDRVKVAQVTNNWTKITPPMDSFSWISQQYVTVDPNQPTVGTVTGDSVVVRAGSSDGNPLHSETEQIKLGKGTTVQVISKSGNDYYKIVPPAGVYLWVSQQFTHPLGKVGEIAILSYPETDRNTIALPVTSAAVMESNEPNDPNAVKVVVTKGPNSVKDPNAPKAKVVKPVSTQSAKLKEYFQLSKNIITEKQKPLEQQDYTQIKNALTAIMDDKNSGKAGEYAKFALEQVERYETAAKVAMEVKLQDTQYQQTRSNIENTQKAKLAKIQITGRYAIKGLFKLSSIYGSQAELRHYQIVDEIGNVVCFALPTGPALNMNLDKFIGKKVGLVGKIEAHTVTTRALIRFTEIDILE